MDNRDIEAINQRGKIMKIVDYKVIIGDDLEDRVMELISEGYEPLGGVAIRHGSSRGHSFVQTMIKYNTVSLDKINGDVMQDFLIWLSGREHDISNGNEDFYKLQDLFEQLTGRKPELRNIF